jgi:hypothetical protein
MISYMILDMTSYIKIHFLYLLCPAAANPRPAQRVDETDDDQEPDCDSPMDFDEVRDHADQGPLTDMDMEGDAEIISDDPYCALPTIRIWWNTSTSRPIST